MSIFILQCKNTVGGLNRRFYWVWQNGHSTRRGRWFTQTAREAKKDEGRGVLWNFVTIFHWSSFIHAEFKISFKSEKSNFTPQKSNSVYSANKKRWANWIQRGRFGAKYIKLGALYSLLELKRPPKTPITHTCITFGLWVGLKCPLDISVQLKSLLVFKFW